jgi:hypothetical protein
VNGLGLDNVSKLDAMSNMSQAFVDNLVHLTKDSSTIYVNGLLYNLGNLFTEEIIALKE